MHPDVLVDADRRRVLGADEQADGRHSLEQEAAEVAHSPLGITAAADDRIDPDLLQLHGRGRPRRRLRLEQDPPLVDPEPRAAVLDLHPRPPAEALRVARERVDPELFAVGLCAGGDEQLEVFLGGGAQSRLAGLGRLLEHVDRLAGPVLARRSQPVPRLGPEVADRVLLADHEPGPSRAVDARKDTAAAPRGHEVRADVAERAQAPVLREPGEAAEPAPRDVLEEHALDRVLGAEGQDLVQRRFDQRGHPCNFRVSGMPIHVRAEPGEYGEACLLPGDPLRAKYIAETYFDNPVQRNGERGMLGYSGEWEGKPVSVQSTGMGCPSAAIVMEELVQLGVKRFLRVGTCGGLQQDLELGDLIVAVSAVPADGTAWHYGGGEPHVPTADWELVHPAVHAAQGRQGPLRLRAPKEPQQRLRVGAIAPSDSFYDPDPERHKRWSARGVLGVEMEAAVLFTIGSLRGVKAGCLLTVSDIVIGEKFTRIPDDELRAAVDRMTRVALATVTD